MVVAEISGNMIRPPNRSASAPTGIRPTDPTTTGTATSSACWNGLRCNASLNFGASGLSSAHAQKFTANPAVAMASINDGRQPIQVAGPAPDRVSRIIAVLILATVDERS